MDQINLYIMNTLKKLSFILFMLLCITNRSSAFCGFYVAKADAGLFNKTSQVIMVRDGNHTVITMSSDFKGNVHDFAMVVPVPVVLQKDDIRITERILFDKLDAYSGPRLVEYHDQNPCNRYVLYDLAPAAVSDSKKTEIDEELSLKEDKYKVTIEAKYTVGEYDILILSANESSGLEGWLTENGYKIPKGAKDVLEPYIKSNMKFFVVKVNLDEVNKSGNALLRPLQIHFDSPKFMLPLRLGMANAKEDQDMIVYAITKTGRVETTNYRTVKIPTDRNVPEFVEDVFGKFYVDVYKRNRNREGKNNVFLEYGWNISGNSGVKCDPCPSPPPIMSDLVDAGVNWLQPNGWNGYNGNVYFTRLHVTYNRENFPQDLVFQETQNTENFQGRYIVTHPAQGPFDCDEGKRYKSEVKQRREKELQQLASLTGWDVSYYRDYIYDFYDYELPSQPVMHKTHVNPLIQKEDTTGALMPGDDVNNKSGFTPVYASTSGNNEKNDYATPAFIVLSLIMLVSVIRNKMS
jgi:hypothetical protein